MKPIEALADCIMRFEGWHYPTPLSQLFPKGSTSWRNRNPGNLRPTDKSQKQDEKGYRIFDSLSDGYQHLVEDLEAKIIYGSHDITEFSTLHDLFNIYAPSLDKNNPQQYSRQVAQWLCDIFQTKIITADTTLSVIMKMGS